MEGKSIGQCCMVLLAHWPIESYSTIRRYALLHVIRLHTGTVSQILDERAMSRSKPMFAKSKIQSAKAILDGYSAIWDTGVSRHTGQRQKTSSGSVSTSGMDYAPHIYTGALQGYQKVHPMPPNMPAFDPIEQLWCILTHMPYRRGCRFLNRRPWLTMLAAGWLEIRIDVGLRGTPIGSNMPRVACVLRSKGV